MSEEIYIRLDESLPCSVKACVSPGIDSYNIYVNPMYCREDQIEAVCHELKHIVNDDCYRNEDINLIERRTNEEAK